MILAFAQQALIVAGITPNVILGIVFGLSGVVYGLKAKEFVSSGFYGAPSKEPERVSPEWYHRLLVVSISTGVLILSLRTLLKNP